VTGIVSMHVKVVRRKLLRLRFLFKMQREVTRTMFASKEFSNVIVQIEMYYI